jgi:GalNAc5-diNAcBac-PP-undecaprenol beta-1,3-glucosyltransferase
MIDDPLVSVIIPTYNRETLLCRAIESVIRQTYKKIEIIITDDNSTDGSEVAIKKYITGYDKNIKYVKNSKYLRGPCGNKNNGFDNATGEWITILDDDDILLPDSVEFMLNTARSKKYKMVFGNCQRSDGMGVTGHGLTSSREVNFSDAVCGRFYGDFSGMFHISLLGGKRFDDFQYGGENTLWLQFYKQAPAFYIDKIVRVNNVEGESVMLRRYNEPKRCLRFYENILKLLGDEIGRFCPKILTKMYSNAAVYASMAGLQREGAEYAIKGILAYPYSPRIYVALILSALPTVFVKKLVATFIKPIK